VTGQPDAAVGNCYWAEVLQSGQLRAVPLGVAATFVFAADGMGEGRPVQVGRKLTGGKSRRRGSAGTQPLPPRLHSGIVPILS